MKEKIIAWILMLLSIPAVILSFLAIYVGFSIFKRWFLFFWIFYFIFFKSAVIHSIMVLRKKSIRKFTMAFLVLSIIFFLLHLGTFFFTGEVIVFVYAVMGMLAIAQCHYQLKIGGVV